MLFLYRSPQIVEKNIVSLKIENATDAQNVNDDVKTALAECKKTKSHLYVFTRIVPYVKLTKFVEELLQRNNSKSVRSVKKKNGK